MIDEVYRAHRNLVAAILEDGIEDVERGHPDAIEWLEGDEFTHWCAWLGIDPDRARAAIRPKIKTRPAYVRKRDLTQEEVRTALTTYNKYGNWKIGAQAIGVSVTHLRNWMIEAGYHTPRPRK